MCSPVKSQAPAGASVCFWTSTAVTRETLDEKGLDGTVGIAARAAEQQMPLIYSVRLPGRTAALAEMGLLAADLDDCCALHQGYHDSATGHRRAAVRDDGTDGGVDARGPRLATCRGLRRDDGWPGGSPALGRHGIGLISYAAADGTIQQIVVKADTVDDARRLRSLDDERTALAWVDGGSGAPIVTVPEQGEIRHRMPELGGGARSTTLPPFRLGAVAPLCRSRSLSINSVVCSWLDGEDLRPLH
jgi:hypothetical protein